MCIFCILCCIILHIMMHILHMILHFLYMKKGYVLILHINLLINLHILHIILHVMHIILHILYMKKSMCIFYLLFYINLQNLQNQCRLCYIICIFCYTFSILIWHILCIMLHILHINFKILHIISCIVFSIRAAQALSQHAMDVSPSPQAKVFHLLPMRSWLASPACTPP